MAEEATKAAARAELAKLAPKQQACRRCGNGSRRTSNAGRKQPLKEGLSWPAPARMKLAVLAETIYGHVGWRAKKPERRQKIAALRG